MPSFAQWFALAASVLPAVVVAMSVEPACTGDDCDALGSSTEEEAALLQVHRANASEVEVRSEWKNPCGIGYAYLPKQSTQKDCQAAGFKYVGNKDAAEDASNCCVKATWTCNLGTKRDCKPDKVASPKFLGVITWMGFDPRGNCCVAPNPATSPKATWTFDSQEAPKKKYCQTKEVSKSCTIDAFWTGTKCMTTAKVSGKYQQATCKKSLGQCKGLDIGRGVCCTC